MSTISAIDRRAEKNGWSPADRLARQSFAAAARSIRSHYRQEMPDHSKLMIGSAVNQMRQAMLDCRRLDELRAHHGLPPLFVENFTVYNHSAALAGIHCRALAELKALYDGKTPAFSAMKEGDAKKAFGKRTLELIRESLRDGWPLERAMAINSDGIQRMIVENYPPFFVELGDLFRTHGRKPFQRDLSAWIVRAWLPLCLWECESDGEEAYLRFSHAAELMELNLQGADPAKFYHTFITAWRNVRSKKMKLQRA